VPEDIQTEEEFFDYLLASLNRELHSIYNSHRVHLRFFERKIAESRARITGSWAHYLGFDGMEKERAMIEHLEALKRTRIETHYPGEIEHAKIHGREFLTRVWLALGEQQKRNHLQELRATVQCRLARTRCHQAVTQCVLETPTGCRHPPSMCIKLNGKTIRVPENIDNRASLNHYLAQVYQAKQDAIIRASEERIKELRQAGRSGLLWLGQLQLGNMLSVLHAEFLFCAEKLWAWRQSEDYCQAEERFSEKEKVRAEKKLERIQSKVRRHTRSSSARRRQKRFGRPALIEDSAHEQGDMNGRKVKLPSPERLEMNTVEVVEGHMVEEDILEVNWSNFCLAAHSNLNSGSVTQQSSTDLIPFEVDGKTFEVPEGIQTEEELFDYIVLSWLPESDALIRLHQEAQDEIESYYTDRMRRITESSGRDRMGLDEMEEEKRVVLQVRERLLRSEQKRYVKAVRDFGKRLDSYLVLLWSSLGEQKKRNHPQELRATVECRLTPTKCGQCIFMPTGCSHPPTMSIETNERIIRISENIDHRQSLDEHLAQIYEARRQMIFEASVQLQQEMDRIGRWDLKRLEQLQCENRIALIDVEEPICAEVVWEWRQSERYRRAEQLLSRGQQLLSERKKGPEIKWNGHQSLTLLPRESGVNIDSSDGRSSPRRARSPIPLEEERLGLEDMLESECLEDADKSLMNGRVNLGCPVELVDNAGSDVPSEEDDDDWCERARGIERIKVHTPVVDSSSNRDGGAGVSGVQNLVQSSEEDTYYLFSMI
jgi:hypothetical protein